MMAQKKIHKKGAERGISMVYFSVERKVKLYVYSDESEPPIPVQRRPLGDVKSIREMFIGFQSEPYLDRGVV
jgi:hypothetical protein